MVMVMVMVIINAEGASQGNETACPIGGALWWQTMIVGRQQHGAHRATGSVFHAPSVVRHGISRRGEYC